VALMKVVKDFT